MPGKILKFLSFLVLFQLLAGLLQAQTRWICVDSLYQPLPPSVHLYYTSQPVDTGTFRAYYLEADLRDPGLVFSSDTSDGRRLTPKRFFEKNQGPLAVVNCTFFSFETNRSLNLVVKNGKLVSHNWKPVRGQGADSTRFFTYPTAAIGMLSRHRADVAWVVPDSIRNYVRVLETTPVVPAPERPWRKQGSRWRVMTAVGGGPALIQGGKIRITNNEEHMFAGKAINDKHPRTAMGYTPGGKLIVLAIQGRSPSSGGATLAQEAELLLELGCEEALNLDGGGSSCLLVNGKETIKPSDSQGQRPVPAVFLIKRKE